MNYSNAKTNPEEWHVVFHGAGDMLPSVCNAKGDAVALVDSGGGTLCREQILSNAHLIARAPALDYCHRAACELADAFTAYWSADVKHRNLCDVMNALEAFKWAKEHVENAIARPDVILPGRPTQTARPENKDESNARILSK